MDAQQLSAQTREACSLAGLEGEYNGHSPMIGMALDLAGADFDCKAMSLVRHLASPATASLIIRILNANNVIQPPQRLQADQLGVKVSYPPCSDLSMMTKHQSSSAERSAAWSAHTTRAQSTATPCSWSVIGTALPVEPPHLLHDQSNDEGRHRDARCSHEAEGIAYPCCTGRPPCSRHRRQTAGARSAARPTPKRARLPQCPATTTSLKPGSSGILLVVQLSSTRHPSGTFCRRH